MLAVGQACDADPALAHKLIQEAILEAEPDLASRKNLLLAARCLGECGKGFDRQLLGAMAQALINIWLSADAVGEWGEAIEATFSAVQGSTLADQLAVHLVAVLADADEPLQVRILINLGKLSSGDASVRSALLKSLTRPQATLRQAAAKTLGMLGQRTPGVIQGLTVALQDSNLGVRRTAVQSLGYLAQAKDELQAPLLAALNDPHLSHAAAEALCAIYGLDSYLLDVAVERLRNAHTREAGLALMRHLAALASAEVELRVVALLDDPAPEVRKSAIVLAQRLGFHGHALVDALLTRLRDDKVRRSAAEALVRIAPTNLQHIVTGLQPFTLDSDKVVQRVAKETLGSIHASHKTEMVNR